MIHQLVVRPDIDFLTSRCIFFVLSSGNANCLGATIQLAASEGLEGLLRCRVIYDVRFRITHDCLLYVW